MVVDSPATASKSDGGVSGSAPRGGAATPALGSRMRSSIPMTPRSVVGSSGNDFARQVAERDASLKAPSIKKFRSAAAPKGTKLASGYTDRTQQRISEEEDDKATRVKALEDMVKLGQMDQATFEALRDEIVGGDVKNVHLVKGLDRKLLERVRRGENVLADKTEANEASTKVASPERRASPSADNDLDQEFEQLADKEVQPVAKPESEKKGVMAPPPPVAGRKRTRDDILKELKASRQAATPASTESQPAKPSLGPRFMKVGKKRESSRIERDERGREVLITVDENGKVKRKVKKAKEAAPPSHGLLMPDKDAKPLGMEIVEAAPAPEVEEVDIFEGVGADYDPLEGLGDGSNDSEDGETDSRVSPPDGEDQSTSLRPPLSTGQASMPPPPLPTKATANKRNYFGDAEEDPSANTGATSKSLDDPTILAALKKAATLKPLSAGDTDSVGEEETAKLARRRKMLENQDRDAEDMDLGFGSSRFGDEEEADGKKVKLSAWGKDGEDGQRIAEGKGPRKRGPKKKKGDANNAEDVLKAMQRMKEKRG
ncbi:MAG: hypothetical protein Q9191_000809 [Dirinaria sp. TL-2023a]